MTALQQFESKNNVSLLINNEASTAIKLYLKTLSKNTQKNYNGRFNKFFVTVTGSTIDTVTWEQLRQINYTNIASYQEFLKDTGIKNKSINQNMTPISKMFVFLSKKYPEQNINPNILSTVKLPESVHEDNPYGNLSEEEIYNLLSFCDEIKYRPVSQKLFFELMFITALRFDAVRTLTVNNIHHVEDPTTKQMVYLIKNIDKSKDRTIAIPNDIADRLFAEHKSNDIVFKIDNPDRVFALGDHTLRNTLSKFCKKYNIPKERNITLHSVKKASINNALHITNDNLKEVAIFGGHTDINTTLKYYANMHTNYTEQISMRVGKDDEDMRRLERLSKKELLELIQKAGIGTTKKLVNIYKNRNKK